MLLRSLSLCLAAALPVACAELQSVQPRDASASRTRQPNIVFIMADELGYYELSCMGHPHIRTPNIDRLAEEGTRFTQCLAGSPLCAPTRCVLLTGKHSGHTSVRTNGGGTPMRAGEETIGSVLKRAGYATGGYGKWGCGGRGSSGVPEQHGFDEFVGYYDQVHAHTYYPPYIIRNSEEIPLEGNRGGSDGEKYSHYTIVEAAKDFIRRSHEQEQPFFCYLPVTPPHGIFDIPDYDPAWRLYSQKPWPEQARRYAAMVTMLDRQVGELRTLLEQLGIADNTLIVFSGDNGGNDYFKSKEHPRGFHRPNVDPETGVEFRGTKGRVYEGGLRVPFVVHWPGHVTAGRVTDHLCYFPDLLPTFAEFAGAEVPDDVDGISFVPELLGEEQRQHDYLYWELGAQTAVRRGDWKAVRTRKNGAWSLYDLSQDVSEQHDVAGDNPDILAKLVQCAEAAHEPAVEGDWGDRVLHEKDRRAKGGNRKRDNRKIWNLPKLGLLPRKGWKVARVSSEHAATGKLAELVLDGKPRTHWHTRFGDEVAKHPHELVLDMQVRRNVRGLAYLARQDRGWNGTFGECELFVGDDVDTIGTGDPVLRATFGKKKTPQLAECDPTPGRYVLIRVKSEAGGGPWASAAEIGLIGK